MSKLSIQITDKETGNIDNLDTTGYLLLYLSENEKVKITGKLDMSALAPILTRIALEKLSK